jgi:hypothetical protein
MGIGIRDGSRPMSKRILIMHGSSYAPAQAGHVDEAV